MVKGAEEGQLMSEHFILMSIFCFVWRVFLARSCAWSS